MGQTLKLPALLTFLILAVITNSQAEWTFHDFTVLDNLTTVTHFATFFVENHNLQVKELTYKPMLQLTVHGLNVSNVASKVEMNDFSMDLSDKSSIHIERMVTEATKQIVEYRFVWKGAGPSLDREVCFHYGATPAKWYSTYEEKQQHWPLDTNLVIHRNQSFTTGDFLQKEIGNIIEHLFLTSDGFGIMLGDVQPWFLRRDPNRGDPILCVAVSNEFPYQKQHQPNEPGFYDLSFSLRLGKNVKSLWQSYVNVENKNPNMNGLIGVPMTIPDKEIFTHPIWSTWARFHVHIFQQRVLDFGAEIQNHSFPHAQLEIDDKWETHYGDLEFDPVKFPNAKQMIADLHSAGFRVTIWTYPFINKDSAQWELSKEHFMKDGKGEPLIVHWWTGTGSPIDLTSPDNVKWFVNRLETFKNETGINAFKFDAGELNWYGGNYEVFDKKAQEHPNLLTTAYVEACAKLGGMIEVRSAYKSQHLPIFVRMMDKGSDWTWNNGLRTLIPTALTMSIAGYPFNLPDMIGGNGQPPEELLIRWIQANTFLPSMQFSVPPWTFGDKVVAIARKAVDLHAAHAPMFIALAERARFGEPIIRPMWWAEPEDPRTFAINDQFLVGDNLLVAPIVERGKIERSVYFPTGIWIDEHGKEFHGPAEIQIQAPLELLPFYKKKQN